MDKYRRPIGSAEPSDQENASSAAESVQRDFSDLVTMLDCQLANLSETDERARAHLLEAKVAAERGLTLSSQLIELLRAAD